MQILEDTLKSYSIDTNQYKLQNYTCQGFDKFLILNKEGNNHLIATLNWVQYDANKNINSTLHSLIFYQYSSYQLLYVEMMPHTSQINYLLQGGQGKVITVSALNTLKIWNLTSFKLDKKIPKLQSQINDIIYDQADDMIIVCTSQPSLIFYDYQTLQVLQSFSKFYRNCSKITIGFFRKNLIASESDGRIIIFNYKTMLPIQYIHLDTTNCNVLFMYPLFFMEEYNQITNYSEMEQKEKEGEKKVIVGNQSGKSYVLFWKKIEFQSTNNPSMYLKEIQYGIQDKYEFQVGFTTSLKSEVKEIIIDYQLDLMIQCSRDQLLISSFQNGEEIQRIDMDIPAYSSGCLKIIIIHEYMELYVQTSDNILIYNLAYIINGPFFQKFQNGYQESTNSIKAINSKLNMYLFRNSESNLILIDQNNHNSFLMNQNLQYCQVQDYFIFYENYILMKCSQYKILVYQFQSQSKELLLSSSVNQMLQQQIERIQIIKQSIFFPQVFYIINAPSEIVVLRFQKQKQQQDIAFELFQTKIEMKLHVKDILMICRFMTAITYFDGSFQLCNVSFRSCNSLIVGDFSNFINGFAINPLNSQKIYFYSNSGQINYYQINFNQEYFQDIHQIFEDEINCKKISNVKYPNSDYLNVLPNQYLNEIEAYLNEQNQGMSKLVQLDEIDFINAKLNFTSQLVDHKNIITEPIDECHVFKEIKIFITPVFSQGLIYIWDLEKFEMLSNIQVPSLSFLSYIKICSSQNSFFLITSTGLSFYEYNKDNSIFHLSDSYYTINDQIQNPRTNFLNYFADYSIITSTKGYQIINFKNKFAPENQRFIQKIEISNPVIVSVEMVTDLPEESQVSLIVFGFSNQEIFLHYIYLKQMDSCIVRLDSYGLNEIQEELSSIETNQEIQQFKVNKFKIKLQFQDIFNLLNNIPNFKYSKQSSLNISGISQIKQSIISKIKQIQIVLNWQKLILQNIEVDSSTVQINSSIQIAAEDIDNIIVFKNIKFQNFYSDLLFEIKLFSNATVSNAAISRGSFSSQTLFKFYECNLIQFQDFKIEEITASNFTLALFQGRYTILSFQNLLISEIQIINSNIQNSELFVMQFGKQANISNITIQNNLASNTRLFEMQGIISTTLKNSSFFNNTSLFLLNSSREIIINYDTYSQFQVYESNFYLFDTGISNCQIDQSTLSLLSFRKQKVFINNLNISDLYGIKTPIPLIFQIPYYNTSIYTQENSKNNTELLLYDSQQQYSYSSLFSIIKCDELNSMEIKNSNFLNMKQVNHVIQSRDSELIRVINCNFKNIQDKYSTNGLVYSERSIMQVSNSNFQDNVSHKCTNFLFLDSPVSSDANSISFIKNSKFTNNHAQIFGGGLCFSNSQITFIDSDFIQNRAQFGGAIFYFYDQDYLKLKQGSLQNSILNNSKFFNNSADIFGVNYASGLSYMQPLGLKFDGENYVIDDFRSGDSLSSLKVLLFDQEKQMISNDALNSLNFKLKPIKQINVKIINQSDFEQKMEGEIFYLTNDRLRIFGQPGEDGYIYYTSDFIDNSQVDNLLPEQQSILKIKLKFRKCIIGEIQRLEYVDEQNQKNYFSCFQCPEGKYSLIEGSYDPKNKTKMCQLCPSDKATFCEKDKIMIKQGFWRESKMSDVIVECKNNPEACLGEDQCQEGHIGPLCEDCDITGEVYGKKQGFFNMNITYFPFQYLINNISKRYTRINNEVFQCSQCENNFPQIFIMFLLQAAITSYLVWSIKTSLDRSKQIVMADLMRKLTLVSLGRSSQTNTTTAFIKIIAHYVQVISCLKYYHPQYPSFGLLYVDYIGDPVDKSTFAFDCILIDFEYLNIPFEYLIIIWSQIYQIMYLLLYLSIYFCLIKMKKVQYKQYANRNAIIFFILYIQNSVISQLVSVISCRRIGGKSYIRSAISKMCYTNDFYQYSFKLVVPLLSFWALLVPLIGFCLIFRIRKKLFTFFNTLNYGLIYLDYKPKYYYWEFIRIIIKIIIIFIVNYFYQSIYYQGIFSLLVILLYSYLLQNLEPYKEKRFNKLEQKSTFVQFTFFFLVLVQQGLEIQQYSYLSWVIVVINLVFLVYLIYLCISYQITKQQIFILLYKIPCLRKCVENKIPQQQRIFNAQQLWRSLSIYVRDFLERKKLNKNAEFYVQHLQLGNSQSNLYRVSQVKTSQQFKEILKQSTQISQFIGEQKESETKHDISLNFNKLQLNEIVTESRVLGKFNAISEEIQEEDPEVQSEKYQEKIPQQLNQIIIPDFYPNQTKLQIDSQSDRIKTEELLDTQENEENKILKTDTSFTKNLNHPSIISPQNTLGNSNQMLIKTIQQQKTEEDLEAKQNMQTKQIPRDLKVKENNLTRLKQKQQVLLKKNSLKFLIKKTSRQNKEQDNINLSQQQDSKVIASLFTPRNNEKPVNNPVQSYREAFAQKMKKTISFRSAQKQ